MVKTLREVYSRTLQGSRSDNLKQDSLPPDWLKHLKIQPKELCYHLLWLGEVWGRDFNKSVPGPASETDIISTGVLNFLGSPQMIVNALNILIKSFYKTTPLV